MIFYEVNKICFILSSTYAVLCAQRIELVDFNIDLVTCPRIL